MAVMVERFFLGGFGGFSSYLVEGEGGRILIDTGIKPLRAAFVSALRSAGVEKVDLVLLTNGTMDSAGNAAFARDFLDAPVGLHPADCSMVSRGERRPRESSSLAVRAATFLLRPLARRMSADQELFEPDLELREGDELARWGVDARVVELPGFTAGSIGLLCAGGELFTGNAAINRAGRLLPPFATAGLRAMEASLERALGLGATMIYPCMGEPMSAGEMGDRFKKGRR